jgi:hypothetical protein
MFARRLFALIVIVLASAMPPASKALEAPAAWPIVQTYAAQGMTVTMTADCYTDYGLVITWDLIATTTAIKQIGIVLDYAGHFERSRWDNLTPIYPGPNQPARLASWAPEFIGRNARITLSGWAPCSTKIGPLTSTYANRYWLARIMH